MGCRLGEADRWQERQMSLLEALQAEQQRKLQVAGRILNGAEEEVSQSPVTCCVSCHHPGKSPGNIAVFLDKMWQ